MSGNRHGKGDAERHKTQERVLRLRRGVRIRLLSRQSQFPLFFLEEKIEKENRRQNKDHAEFLRQRGAETPARRISQNAGPRVYQHADIGNITIFTADLQKCQQRKINQKGLHQIKYPQQHIRVQPDHRVEIIDDAVKAKWINARHKNFSLAHAVDPVVMDNDIRGTIRVVCDQVPAILPEDQRRHRGERDPFHLPSLYLCADEAESATDLLPDKTKDPQKKGARFHLSVKIKLQNPH